MSSFDDPQLPVKVQAALALTELVLSSEQVKAAVGPQVGKVIQGGFLSTVDCCFRSNQAHRLLEAL